MIALKLGLAAAIVATAWAVVHTQYTSRQLYVALDGARAQASELEVEWETLRAQRRSDSAPARIQQLAQQQLRMRAPDPATTLYLAPPAASGAKP